jgi:hypothetical protein
VKRTLLTLATVVLSSGAALAQVRAGGEFRVNTYTTDQQYFPAAAFDRAGGFVVVWSSYRSSTVLTEVVGQRYNAAGARIGAEFTVNSTQPGFQYTNQVGTPVAMRPDGRFVVVWSDLATATSRVRGRRFAADGSPEGAEFQVDPGGPAHAYAPNVAIAAHGTFVVVWAGAAAGGPDIFVRRIDATANPLGAAFRANTATTGTQTAPRVAMAEDGGFVVVWQDQAGNDGSGHGVFGQRFDPAGAPVGGQFQVNTNTTGNQFTYGVAAGADGHFVVSWDSLTDGSGFGVAGQRYDATGVPLGPDFVVNQATTGGQNFSSVSSDRQFNFVAAWQSDAADGSSYAIRGQRFDAQGARRGTEFAVSTYTTFGQQAAVIASDEVGNFVVTWHSNNQDGSDLGVFAQRFGGLVPAGLRVDTAGNGVLEPGEVGTVLPTWRNVNGAAQTFAGDIGRADGPPNGIPQILDSVGVYGTVANGVSAECTTCYSVLVPNPPTRPAFHWDGSVVEAITPDAQGQQKTWPLHVGATFADVATASPFYPFIETLLHHGVTGGCAGTSFCPLAVTSREQMAVFVLVAREGAGYAPPPCGAPRFPDVPSSSPFCRWVEELARRGVVSGCGGGNYCPSAPVSREQMAVFGLRTHQPAFTPPPCAPPNLFADVPETSPFCPWVEELAIRGVVSGCGGGNYCPTASVTREQMGVFISVTFGLTLYGP